MKGLLLTILCLTLPLDCFAQEINIDRKTKKVCNEVINNIYMDIVAIKDKHAELINFGGSALVLDELSQLNQITYSYDITNLRKDTKSQFGDAAFSFYVRVSPINAQHQSVNIFEHLSYPNLGIKLYGSLFNPMNEGSNLYKEIFDVVENNSKLLFKLNQKHSSLRLTITSDKEKYVVGESIKLFARVTNVGNSSICINTFGRNREFKVILNNEDGKQFVQTLPQKDPGRLVARKDIKCIESGKAYVLKELSGIINYILQNSNNPIRTGSIKLKVEHILHGPSEFEDVKLWTGILTSHTITIEVVEGKILSAEKIHSKKQKDIVETILRNQNRRDWGKTPAQEHAEDLKLLGDAAIPLLAAFLTDYDLGYEASETMLVINAEKAAPLIFSSMPQSNRNVQYHTFKYFRRKIQNYQPFQFSLEMHGAAVRCLEANTNADVAEEALFAIGLTGSKEDFPLLEKYYKNKHHTKVWSTKLRNASEAALARLGNEKYINNIVTELKAPVPVPIMFEKALTISNAIKKAAFSKDQRFIPFLCKQLDTPFFREYDTGVAPAWDTAQALNQLINNASPEDTSTSIEFWKAKCVEVSVDKK